MADARVEQELALYMPASAQSRTPSLSGRDSHDHYNVYPQQSLLTSSPTISRRPSRETMVLPTPTMHTQAAISQEHRDRFSALIEDMKTTWYIETFCLLCSIVCMIIIVTILSIHDNTPFESWTFRWASINAVVATLGVVFKSTLLVAVSAALAQGKWTWFRKRASSLETFEAIDAGSREVVASLRLLWHMRGQHLVSAGAFVMALAFLVETFLQLVISDDGRLVDMDASNLNGVNATIRRSTYFDAGSLLVTRDSPDNVKVLTTPEPAFVAALYDGLSTADSRGYQNVSFICSSSNCTWPEYATLAIRNTCYDISEHLKKLNKGVSTDTTASKVSTLSSVTPPAQPLVAKGRIGLEAEALSEDQSPARRQSDSSASWTDWTLDHLNMTLVNTDETMRAANTFSMLKAAVVVAPRHTLHFNDSQALIAAFTLIRADDQDPGSPSWDLVRPSAMECGLELALNLYNSSVVNNQLVERIVNCTSQKVPSSFLPSQSKNQKLYHSNGLSVDAGTLEWNPTYHEHFLWRDNYSLDHSTLRNDIEEQFNVSQKTILSTLDYFNTSILGRQGGVTVKVVLQKDGSALPIYGSPILQPLFHLTDTNATFNAIARSMTNVIRNLGTPMNGTAQQWVRYYQVRWVYLALPLSLLIIGATFVVLSMLDATRAIGPSWKANSLATMIHGPDRALQEVLRSINSNHSLAVAGKIQVRLMKSPEGFALTIVDGSDVRISKPTLPARDGGDTEMITLVSSAIPQASGSTSTLLGTQSIGGEEQAIVRSVSPAFGPDDRNSVQLKDLHTFPGVS